jgi:hypothetical protein
MHRMCLLQTCRLAPLHLTKILQNSTSRICGRVWFLICATELNVLLLLLQISSNNKYGHWKPPKLCICFAFKTQVVLSCLLRWTYCSLEAAEHNEMEWESTLSRNTNSILGSWIKYSLSYNISVNNYSSIRKRTRMHPKFLVWRCR